MSIGCIFVSLSSSAVSEKTHTNFKGNHTFIYYRRCLARNGTEFIYTLSN